MHDSKNSVMAEQRCVVIMLLFQSLYIKCNRGMHDINKTGIDIKYFCILLTLVDAITVMQFAFYSVASNVLGSF